MEQLPDAPLRAHKSGELSVPETAPISRPAAGRATPAGSTAVPAVPALRGPCPALPRPPLSAAASQFCGKGTDGRRSPSSARAGPWRGAARGLHVPAGTAAGPGRGWSEAGSGLGNRVIRAAGEAGSVRLGCGVWGEG